MFVTFVTYIVTRTTADRWPSTVRITRTKQPWSLTEIQNKYHTKQIIEILNHNFTLEIVLCNHRRRRRRQLTTNQTNHLKKNPIKNNYNSTEVLCFLPLLNIVLFVACYGFAFKSSSETKKKSLWYSNRYKNHGIGA